MAFVSDMRVAAISHCSHNSDGRMDFSAHALEPVVLEGERIFEFGDPRSARGQGFELAARWLGKERS